jgi:DNA-binding MarR family transcriptional regulator
MAAQRHTKAALAKQVWRSLFDFIVDTASHRNRVLGHYELTPNDSRALFALDAVEGRTMGSLAEAWGCDASNATWVVDRLEDKGLVERRALEGDRRVKLVALTRKGVETKAALMRDLYQPPPELLELDAKDLEALSRAATKLRARGVGR